MQEQLTARLIQTIPMVSLVRRAIRQHSLITYIRLYVLSKRRPRGEWGSITLPIGRIEYVDARSLVDQYSEIFINGLYDVQGVGMQPRILDCGGNIGLSAIWFARRYPGGRIIAFEPDLALVPILTRNLELTGHTDVEVIDKAVGATTGRVPFAADGRDGGRVTGASMTTVSSIRLSDWLAEPVDILKLDIEGSEYDVLDDLCATGKITLVRHLMCEFHGCTETQGRFQATCAALTVAGFRVTIPWAGTVPGLPGPEDPTPFGFAPSGKHLLYLYAWRPQGSL